MIDVSTITVAQFQAQFFRDFAYLDDLFYNPTQTYNTGDEVFFNLNWFNAYDSGGSWDSGAAWDSFSSSQSNLNGGLFYQALIDGVVGVNPGSDATKWSKVADNINNYIPDQDVTNAFAEATESFNPALFDTDSGATMAFLYMTAHYLCNDLKASAQGISAPGAFPVSARSVGSVSETYNVPEAYTKDPLLAMYTQSSYGMKYLAMVLPRLRGNMVAAFGGTNP